jgi:hypothetical protein
MKNQPTDIQISGIDTKALSTLIIELNIARRNFNSYPQGHPLIDSSLQKVISVYAGLFASREEIVIGVTREALMVEGVPLDKSNLVYRDFAGILFEHSIGALVLHPGLNFGELKSFTGILNMKREEIINNGGIETIWETAGITAISIKSIRYDLFSTVEEATLGVGEQPAQTEDLWERFAHGLTQGLLNHEGSAESELDPELLASILNQKFKIGENHQSDYAQSITNFMNQGDIFNSTVKLRTEPYYEKLATFVSNMNPELRQQFLNSAFDVRSSGKKSVAEEIVNRFSTDTVVDMLGEINRNNLGIPPVIMGLLQRLGQHDVASNQLLDTELPHKDDLCQKMRSIFREHASEEFIPDDYQDKLNQIMADEIPQMGTEEVGDIIGTLNADLIESRISDILLLLVMEDPTAEGTSNLIDSLNDMCSYFLQTGDYAQVLRIIHQTKSEQIPADLRLNFQQHFSQRQFMEEVLNGLRTWGKTKYEDIRMIITEIGEPFIDTLLDQLAEEESMSLRRFLMDRIQEFGAKAVTPIIERLSDNRWYFLRNLVLMIRTIGDISLREKLRTFTRHPHQRVRQEAIKTLLHFHDSAAEQQILQDIESDDPEVQITAIRLSERSASKVIFNKVLSFISRSGLSVRDYELKNAAAQTLAEIGNVEALPFLSRVLDSRNILHPILLARLKLEIVRSIERYPSDSARPILKRLAAGNDRLAQQAVHSLKNISGKNS